MELISDSRQVIRLSNKMIPLCFLFLMFNLHQTEAAPIADGCDKYLGNVSTSGPPSNYINYWNQVTLENNSKWINVEPQRNQYNWQPIKDAYDFCKQKGIPFKYHTFLWNEQYPSWLDGLSAADKKAEVEELIRLVGQKFPDIAYIDVANECRAKSPKWKDALGGAGATGYDWLVWGFETARKYCPKAKLHINEYYCEFSLDTVAVYLKMINVLKERNLIDGIGIQTHDGETKKGYELGVLKKCIDSLATTGIPIYSTELDLSGNDQEQLDWYQKIFPIIWEHPAIQGVTLWGWTDSWLLDLSPPKDARLIINNQERPALKWLRTYVAEHKQTSAIDRSVTAAPRPSFTVFGPAGGDYRVWFDPSKSGSVSLGLFDLQGRRIVFTRIDRGSGPFFTIPHGSIPRTTFVAMVTDENGTRVTPEIPVVR
jgi:endo-1,4-beta-xylanase